MRFERNASELLLFHHVDDGQTAIAKADQELLASAVEANVIGIVTEIDTSCRDIAIAAVEPHRTVAAIGDIEGVGRRHIGNALRLLEARQTVNDFRILQINNRYAIVTKFGQKHPLPC